MLRDFDRERGEVIARHEADADERRAARAAAVAEVARLEKIARDVRAAIEPVVDVIAALPKSETFGLSHGAKLVHGDLLRSYDGLSESIECAQGAASLVEGQAARARAEAERLERADAEAERAEAEELTTLEAEEAEQARLIQAALAKAAPTATRRK